MKRAHIESKSGSHTTGREQVENLFPQSIDRIFHFSCHTQSTFPSSSTTSLSLLIPNTKNSSITQPTQTYKFRLSKTTKNSFFLLLLAASTAAAASSLPYNLSLYTESFSVSTHGMKGKEGKKKLFQKSKAENYTNVLLSFLFFFLFSSFRLQTHQHILLFSHNAHSNTIELMIIWLDVDINTNILLT